MRALITHLMEADLPAVFDQRDTKVFELQEKPRTTLSWHPVSTSRRWSTGASADCARS